MTPPYVTIIVLEPQSDGSTCYVGHHPELPTVIAQGESLRAVGDMLAEMTQAALDHLTANGLPWPTPAPFPGRVDLATMEAE